MTTPPIVSITDELIAELERDFSELTDPLEFGDKMVRKAQSVLALIAERAELVKTLSSLRWRLDDISDSLTARRGGDGESFYGLDEWSTPIINITRAIGIIDKVVKR